jgi:lipopolysaccharide assembly LptE-like protein
MRHLAALALVVLAACGYRVGGGVDNLPQGAQTIHIERFRNHTREEGLDVHLHRAIEDEFRRHGTLQVVSSSDGDLVLSGDIRRLISTPVASGGTDEVLQYQEVLVVAIRLVERGSGKVRFENKQLVEAQDFGAERGVVIASSPGFQRGTINARDLADMTNVQIGPSRRRDAVRDLLDATARDIYRQAVEGF